MYRRTRRRYRWLAAPMLAAALFGAATPAALADKPMEQVSFAQDGQVIVRCIVVTRDGVKEVPMQACVGGAR